MGSLRHELQFLRGSRFSEDLESSESQALRKERQISRKILIFASTVALTGVVCLIVGIALLGTNKASSNVALQGSLPSVDISHVDKNDISTDPKTSRNFTESCSYSREFQKSEERILVMRSAREEALTKIAQRVVENFREVVLQMRQLE